mmetsp:Transcript_62393/g.131894  ORF Transcript_62393/g.131894 Transcript_62393/m.131894 type:complete len:81 (-) Transcript_62393:271-513(-)
MSAGGSSDCLFDMQRLERFVDFRDVLDVPTLLVSAVFRGVLDVEVFVVALDILDVPTLGVLGTFLEVVCPDVAGSLLEEC